MWSMKVHSWFFDGLALIRSKDVDKKQLTLSHFYFYLFLPVRLFIWMFIHHTSVFTCTVMACAGVGLWLCLSMNTCCMGVGSCIQGGLSSQSTAAAMGHHQEFRPGLFQFPHYLLHCFVPFHSNLERFSCVDCSLVFLILHTASLTLVSMS